MKFLAVFCLLSAALLAASSPLSEDRSEQLWANYKEKHGKEYPGHEDAARKANFLRVHAQIEKHNSDPHATYQQVHNQFSDLHDHEKEQLLGAVPPPHVVGDRLASEDVEQRAVPTSLDLRVGSPCVGPVKDQGGCGSCWSFSAIAPLEYSYCMKNGKKYTSLSEEQLVDCLYAGTGHDGCSGGWPDSAWGYLQSAGGSDSTSAYPYTAGSRGTSGKCMTSANKPVAKVASHGFVGTSTTAIMNALNSQGPLSVCVEVRNNFYSIGTGIFTDSTCNCTSLSSPTNTGCNINHAVTNVGYGTASGIDYWIVRNSWSASWGDKGYFKIKKGVNMCGIETYAYTVTSA